MKAQQRLTEALAACPAVAILRGLTPTEAVPVATALVGAGIAVIEVPLNSPDPLTSLRLMREALPAEVVVGAGTVLDPQEVGEIAKAGGEIIVSPNTNASVIEASLAGGLLPLPGILSPTEAFAAIDAGARFLKVFPVSASGSSMFLGLRDVLPTGVSCLAVGGVSQENAAGYLEAGFCAVGVGSGLYRPGIPAEEVAERAKRLVDTLKPPPGR